MKKRCSEKKGCGELKDEEEFYRRPDGSLLGICRECSRKKRKEHYLLNRENALEKGKNYYKNNRDRLRQHSKEYYHTHAELLKEKSLQRYYVKICSVSAPAASKARAVQTDAERPTADSSVLLESQRMRQLKEKNARLLRLAAEQALRIRELEERISEKEEKEKIVLLD